MSSLIVPCAGKSTRFNTNKPKWMLTHPNGNLMLMEAIFGLDLQNVDHIYIAMVKQHIDQSKIQLNLLQNKIYNKIGIKVEFVIFDDFTSSQSDTVHQTICQANINGSIFIKDCDNYFNYQITNDNSICITKLEKNTNAINKSYISINKNGYLSGIVEKQVISDKFCVGGYSFKDAEDFKKSFLQIKNIKSINNNEIYISHIIQQMLLNNYSFDVSYVDNYHDWGTLEEWRKYTARFQTLFIDIDGVICQNGSEFFEPQWGSSEGLLKNIEVINNLYYNGFSKIILTTARTYEYKQETLEQLKKLGVNYHDIIFELLHSKRIVINDYSETNSYPSAIAINIIRNGDDLAMFITP